MKKLKSTSEYALRPSVNSMKEVDEVRLTSIIDNVADRSFTPLCDVEIVNRFQFPVQGYDSLLPIAEHGFSVLIEVKCGESSGAILFDAGVSESGLLHNLTALNIELTSLHAVVISHGHSDHFLGLPAIIKYYGMKGLKLIVHPDAFCERKFRESPDGQEVYMTPLNLHSLESQGFEVLTNTRALSVVNDMILISGEIERKPAFENAIPYHYIKHLGNWELNPSLRDDQCVIVNVRGKGLVVVTGCGHAGIINILNFAQKLTGVEQIFAAFGGFHLYQITDLDAILNSLEELKPRYVIPTHCTGWKGIHEIARRLPNEFIQNSVGSTYTFQAA